MHAHRPLSGVNLRVRLSTLALSFALLTMSSQCFADAFSDAKVAFNGYRTRALSLQNQPQHRYLVGEFASLTQWMNNAERYLSEEEEDDFVRTVQLIRVQLRLIEVSIEEINAREQLLSLTEETTRLEGKAKQEREAIVDLERQMGGKLRSTPAAAPQGQPPAQVPARPQVAPTPAPAYPAQPQIPAQPQPQGGVR